MERVGVREDLRRSARYREKSCIPAATSSTWRPRFRSSSRKTFTRIVFSQRPPAPLLQAPERPVALQQRLLHEVLRFLSFQPARQGVEPRELAVYELLVGLLVRSRVAIRSISARRDTRWPSMG